MFAEPVRADICVWNRWEQTLTNSRAYSNPYQQVPLSVTYRGPHGQQIKGYGFWDGGNTFKNSRVLPRDMPIDSQPL